MLQKDLEKTHFFKEWSYFFHKTKNFFCLLVVTQKNEVVLCTYEFKLKFFFP